MNQKLKKAKSKVNQNLMAVMPMVEEITQKGLVPLCLIGFKILDSGTGEVESCFATLNDEHDAVVLEICQQIVEKHKNGKMSVNSNTTNEFMYDDENPDYIRNSEDGI